MNFKCFNWFFVVYIIFGLVSCATLESNGAMSVKDFNNKCLEIVKQEDPNNFNYIAGSKFFEKYVKSFKTSIEIKNFLGEEQGYEDGVRKKDAEVAFNQLKYFISIKGDFSKLYSTLLDKNGVIGENINDVSGVHCLSLLFLTPELVRMNSGITSEFNNSDIENLYYYFDRDYRKTGAYQNPNNIASVTINDKSVFLSPLRGFYNEIIPNYIFKELRDISMEHGDSKLGIVCYDIALWHLNDENAEADAKIAYKWMQKALDLNSPSAYLFNAILYAPCFDVYEAYGKVNKIEKDYNKSFEYLKKADEYGSGLGVYIMDMYRYMTGEFENLKIDKVKKQSQNLITRLDKFKRLPSKNLSESIINSIEHNILNRRFNAIGDKFKDFYSSNEYVKNEYIEYDKNFYYIYSLVLLFDQIKMFINFNSLDSQKAIDDCMKYINGEVKKQIPDKIDLQISLIDMGAIARIFEPGKDEGQSRSETISGFMEVKNDSININLYPQNSVLYYKKIDEEKNISKIVVDNKEFNNITKNDVIIQDGCRIIINNKEIVEKFITSLKESYTHKFSVIFDTGIIIETEWLDN